ncbi:sulfotransferase family protein [Lentisalinibacter sediminis]|uniref:sulfotransferase family protein n=1 Tax=Lentisalinibacter sediminis TaxID=2992237 RepID=UPI00386752C1
MPKQATDPQPIFIGGCERSGTTMLASMIGRGRHVAVIPEAQFLIRLIESFGPCECYRKSDFVRELEDDPRFAIWNIEPPGRTVDAKVNLGEYFRELITEFVEQRHIERWVDHTPWSISYMKRLLGVFPEARFIHLVRDGRAVAASILSLPDWPFASIIGIAEHWQNRIAAGFAAQAAHPDRVITVRYEDLVSDSESELTRICEWLGVAYEHSMLERNNATLPAYTKGQHGLVGRKPRVERISAWRSSLTSKQIDIFETLTGDLLEMLGYEMLGNPTRRITRTERFAAALVDGWAAGIGRMRRRRRLRRHIKRRS